MNRGGSLRLVAFATMGALGCGSESGTTPDSAGSTDLSASANPCPVIAGVTLSPLAAPVGGVVDLSVSATDVNGDPLSFSWVAPSGWLSDPTSSATRLVCTAAGPLRVVVTVSDGQCDEHATVDLTCL